MFSVILKYSGNKARSPQRRRERRGNAEVDYGLGCPLRLLCVLCASAVSGLSYIGQPRRTGDFYVYGAPQTCPLSVSGVGLLLVPLKLAWKPKLVDPLGWIVPL
jgi:hypothetical protein